MLGAQTEDTHAQHIAEQHADTSQWSHQQTLQSEAPCRQNTHTNAWNDR